MGVYQYCAPVMPWSQVEFFGEKAVEASEEEILPHHCRLGKPIDPAGYDIPSRLNPSETVHLSPQELAKYFVTFVADLAEQMMEVNTYIHIYHEVMPDRLFPGRGRPAIIFHFYSRLLFSARPYLDVVPPVFNNCTEVLNIEDEVQALEFYWQGICEEQTMPKADLEELFVKASKCNPYIAEPRVMLSQLLFMRGAYAEAAHHAICALEIFYQWGTCWDKRAMFGQWVGFARMALLRAKRCEQGLSVLPSRQLSANGKPDEHDVTYLQDVLKDFDKFTESPNKQARL